VKWSLILTGKAQAMERKRFTEEQIIGILEEHALGAKTSEVCRKPGINEATFYNSKSKFGGMDVSEAKRLKRLEAENAFAVSLRISFIPVLRCEVVERTRPMPYGAVTSC
jgi:putative transposase